MERTMTGAAPRKNEAEKMRKLAEVKEMLERRIANTEAELEEQKTLLEFVNQTLLEKGFKRAEIAKSKRHEPQALPPVVEYETVIPLKAATGKLLANLYMSRESMRVVVAEGEAFNVKTPPFHQFLVERVLSKMQEKDREAVGRRELPKDKALAYELILEGDTLKEIQIRNLTADRLRELRSSIHWTLEKMHEKTPKDA
ncbi:MAG TPA: hypothetical protein VMW14_02170 [Candidatus Paceibacterota bacterium]|nr:hypothetical protein [Candidatus Paceibacterota bacterium]